jgi:hypothetical protein
VFPKFRDYYASTILIIWGWLQEDPQRFSALTIRSFQESEHLIRSHGPRWIGQHASLNALHGLATITRVAKAVAVLLDKTPADLRPNDSDGDAWANALIAYVMAFSAVRVSLAALAEDRTPSTKLENVAALANWSKTYAVNAYHLAKAIGLLKTVHPRAPVGCSDDEDLVLAEAGLDSYAEGLAQDDRP